MTPDSMERRGVRHGPFTTWQWAVLGAYFVAIVASLVIWKIADVAVDNTKRIDSALCAQIDYLAQLKQEDDPNATSPSAQELVHNLRILVPSCPPEKPF